MKRKIFLILSIALQIIVLMSFIVRYEILKSTGTTIYIPVIAYDPTDLFRGDYVNISYSLPYSGSIDTYIEGQYIIPKIDQNRITGIESITTKKPTSGLFFQIRTGWMRESTQNYTLDTGSGNTIDFVSSFCQTEGKPGEEVLYLSGKTMEVQTIRVLTAEDKRNSIEQGWSLAKLVSKGSCSGTYQFSTIATDRFFVPEGTGTELEKKIRDGKMYAEWKVGTNGATIMTNIVSQENIPEQE